MTIDRQTLLDALKATIPAVETGKDIKIEGADTFIFCNGNVYTYKDDMAISVPLNLDGLEGAIHAEEFYKVLSKMKSDEITIEASEDNRLWKVTCGKAKVEVVLIDFDYKARVGNIDTNDEWMAVPNDFRSAVGSCMMLGNKTKVAGVYVNNDVVTSTDMIQISQYRMSGDMPTFYITDKSASNILKYDVKQVQSKGSWIHFKLENGSVISVRQLDSSRYPYSTIEKLMSRFDESKSIFTGSFPMSLKDAVDRALNYSMFIDSHNAVKLSMSKDGIEVSTSRESGNYSESVDWETPVEKDFAPIDIYMDIVSLEYILQRILKFYVLECELRGMKVKQVYLKSESSIHLVSTLVK